MKGAAEAERGRKGGFEAGGRRGKEASSAWLTVFRAADDEFVGGGQGAVELDAVVLVALVGREQLPRLLLQQLEARVHPAC